MSSQRSEVAERRPVAAATPVTLGLRTGPLGRVIRLFGAVVLGTGLSSFIQTGVGHFGRASEVRSPAMWILTVVVAILLIDLIVRFLPFSRTVRGLILAAVITAVIVTLIIRAASPGPLWAPPLSSLIWWIDVIDLSFSTASLVLSIPVGTPGCEKVAWAEVYIMLRGGRRPAGRWCVGGLHVIDNWEIARRLRRAQA